MPRIPREPIPPKATHRPAVKVFSATKASERNSLGEQITHWLNQAPEKLVNSVEVRQSSDNEFHCLSITYFYLESLS